MTTRSELRTNTSSSHPSLGAPQVPARNRRGGFGERVDSNPPRRQGLVEVAGRVAEAAGPVGMIAQGVRALSGTAGASGPDPRGEQIDEMWAMQQESQLFNLEYLALQDAMQSENRRFTTLSNLLKARHDTAKSAISNIRV